MIMRLILRLLIAANIIIDVPTAYYVFDDLSDHQDWLDGVVALYGGILMLITLVSSIAALTALHTSHKILYYGTIAVSVSAFLLWLTPMVFILGVNFL